MGVAEDAFEAASKQVLQRLLGGEVVDRDTDGAQSTRDFDLVVDGVVSDAVEVTSVQRPAARATRAGIEKLSHRDLGLTASWHVYIREEAQARPIEREAPCLLNRLYARGIFEFDHLNPPADPALADVVDKVESLHVPKGYASESTPFRLHAGYFGSGSLDAANITRALETEATKDDNCRKLANAPAGAVRHLFVWLHDSDWYVSSLLRDPISTPPAPLLPDEVDVIWAAVGDGPGEVTCTALLRADRTGLVEIDPTSGAALPRRVPPGAAAGPPDDPATCPVCHAPGIWTVWTVKQLAPTTNECTNIRSWKATCSRDATHWGMPGRALSCRELASLHSPNDTPEPQ